MFDVFLCTPADVVGGLLITSSRHLSVLVYLCNKLVIVVALPFFIVIYVKRY